MTLENGSMRSKRPRVRAKTGCMTCRIRRVKCDEAKPYCVKCTSTGRKCDGYTETNVDPPRRVSTSRIKLSPPPPISLFSYFGDSVRYLEFYYHCASRRLSQRFDREFWSRISLQLAHSEPAFRHALIALSYLFATEGGSLKDARSPSLVNGNHKFLLLHYNEAIRTLVKKMEEPSYCHVLGVSTCIFFICIEFMRGEYHSAFTHLHSGLKIISQWRQGYMELQMLQKNSLPSGSADTVETLLMPIFMRTITAALLYGSPVQRFFTIENPQPIHDHHRIFSDLMDAQLSNSQLKNSSILYLRTLGQKRSVGVKFSKEDMYMQQHLRQCHGEWLYAFERLEQVIELSPEESVIANVMKVSSYLLFIAVACTPELDQMIYDQHIGKFKLAIHYIKELLKSWNTKSLCSRINATDERSLSLPLSKGGIEGAFSQESATANFTFDASVIPPLFYIATYCRCPSTRREAVLLLSSGLPREGLWDPEQHVTAAQRAIEIEESEVSHVNGWPIGATRLWSVVINHNMNQDGLFSVSFSGGKRFRGNHFGINEEGRIWEEWFSL